MTFLVNRYVYTFVLSFILIGAGLYGSCTEFGLSLFEPSLIAADVTSTDADDLSSEERTVYNSLGPVYQRIYLHALSNDMRHRVVIYVCRGLTPFEAVNVILRAEQRKYESGRHGKRTLSPGERAALHRYRHKRHNTTG